MNEFWKFVLFSDFCIFWTVNATVMNAVNQNSTRNNNDEATTENFINSSFYNLYNNMHTRKLSINIVLKILEVAGGCRRSDH